MGEPRTRTFEDDMRRMDEVWEAAQIQRGAFKRYAVKLEMRDVEIVVACADEGDAGSKAMDILGDYPNKYIAVEDYDVREVDADYEEGDNS